MPRLNQPQSLSEYSSLQIVVNLHKKNYLLRQVYLDYLMAGFIEEGYTQLCLEDAEYTLRKEIDRANLTRFAIKKENKARFDATLADIEVKGSHLFFNPKRLTFLLQLIHDFLEICSQFNLSITTLNQLFAITLDFYFSKNLRIIYIYTSLKINLFKEVNPAQKEKVNQIVENIHTDILYSLSGTFRNLFADKLLSCEQSVFQFFNLSPHYNFEDFIKRSLLDYEMDGVLDKIVKKFFFIRKIIHLFFFFHKSMETQDALLFVFLRNIPTTHLAPFFESILDYAIRYRYYFLVQELILTLIPVSEQSTFINKIIRDTILCKNFLSELILEKDSTIQFNKTLHFLYWLLKKQTQITEEALYTKWNHLICQLLSYSDYFIFYQALRFSSQADFLYRLKHEAQRVHCWDELLRSSYQVRIECMPLYAAFLNRAMPNQEALTFFWEQIVTEAQSNFSLKKQLVLLSQDMNIIQLYNQHFMRKWLGVSLMETTLENFIWLNNPTLQTRATLLQQILEKIPHLFNNPAEFNIIFVLYKTLCFNLIFDFSTVCQEEVLDWCVDLLKKNSLALRLGWASSYALIAQFINEKSASFIIAFFYAPAKLKDRSIFFLESMWRFVAKYDSSQMLLKNMILGRNTLNINNPFEFTILKNHLTCHFLTWFYDQTQRVGAEYLQKKLLEAHFIHLCCLDLEDISVHPDAYQVSHFKWLLDFSVRFGRDFWDNAKVLMVLRFYFLNRQLHWEDKKIFLDYFFYKIKSLYLIDLDDFFSKKIATEFFNYIIQFCFFDENKKKYLNLIFSNKWFGCMDWLLEKAVEESGQDYLQSILATFFHLLLLLSYEANRKNDSCLSDYFKCMDWCFAVRPKYQLFIYKIRNYLFAERNLDQQAILEAFIQWGRREQIIFNLEQFEFQLKKGKKDFSEAFFIGKLPSSLNNYPLNEIILSDQARKHLVEEGFKNFQDNQSYTFQFSTSIFIRFLRARLEAYSNELPKISFQCADLTAVDFKNTKILSYLFYFTLVNFSQANMQNVVFENCDLSSLLLFFDQAQLQSANFTKSYLEDAVFKMSILDRASFASAELQNIDFTEASLRETCFKHATLKGTGEDFLFDQAILDKSDFSKAILSHIEFLECSLTKVSFKQAQLKEVNFEAANLTEASFNGARLQEKVNFNNAILIKVDFSNCDLQQAIFSGEKLNLDGIQLENTTLTIKQLFYFYRMGITNFETITLIGSFEEADFSLMNLYHAILSPQAITYLIEHKFIHLQGIPSTHLPVAFVQQYQGYLSVKSRQRSEFFSVNDAVHLTSKRFCAEQTIANCSLKK